MPSIWLLLTPVVHWVMYKTFVVIKLGVKTIIQLKLNYLCVWHLLKNNKKYINEYAFCFLFTVVSFKFAGIKFHANYQKYKFARSQIRTFQIPNFLKILN